MRRINKLSLIGEIADRKGIETGTHYTPVHKMSLYKSKTKLPVTENIGNKILTLPMHPNLTEKEINYIIETTNSLID